MYSCAKTTLALLARSVGHRTASHRHATCSCSAWLERLASRHLVLLFSPLIFHSFTTLQPAAPRLPPLSNLCAEVTQPSLARQLLARRGTESDVRDPLASVVSASPLGLLERSVTLARSAVGAQQLRRTP